MWVIKRFILRGKKNMELNLKNMHSPCQNCYIHGHLYSTEDTYCQGCEYKVLSERFIYTISEK